jgi:Prokaryotic E2 family E
MAIAPDPASLKAFEEEQLLPDADIAHLQLRGLKWSAAIVADLIDLIISDYPLPPGYDHERADLLLHLPGGWPDGLPDMFFLFPPVRTTATSAWPDRAASFPRIGDRTWQRWSRHFQNVWRPGVDNLANYLAIVDEALTSSV